MFSKSSNRTSASADIALCSAEIRVSIESESRQRGALRGTVTQREQCAADFAEEMLKDETAGSRRAQLNSSRSRRNEIHQDAEVRRSSGDFHALSSSAPPSKVE